MEELISKLQDAGIVISVVQDSLRVKPRDRITPELLQEIRVNRSKIAAYLRGHKKATLSKPSINEYDELVIPFDSASKYHYWNGGQDIEETLQELETSGEITRHYH